MGVGRVWVVGGSIERGEVVGGYSEVESVAKASEEDFRFKRPFARNQARWAPDTRLSAPREGAAPTLNSH